MDFSIVIPTYNEEKDIAATIDKLLDLDYPDKEIIVVDDSTDSTPKIVAGYGQRGVELIKPEIRKGRSEARNIGIKAAKGDVVVILNADVLLPPDFLRRIKAHYDNGYDSVTVFADVDNMENLYARYVGLHHLRKQARGVYERRKTELKGIFWAEGFSVRRDLALKTSLFPSGFAVPIVAGEDVRFVDELRELGCKGIIDESIVIRHVAPDNFREYWNIRKGRGEGTPQIRRFLDGYSYIRIGSVVFTKILFRFLKAILIVPMVVYNYDLASRSQKNRVFETVQLMYCWLIEQVAFSIGEAQSLLKIIHKEGLASQR